MDTAAQWRTFWRWEALHRADEPVDYLLWKACSSRALRGLPAGQDRQGVPPLLLDSSCGLGWHAMAQARLGFRVEAMDGCPEVLEVAGRAMAAEGLDIPLFSCRWEDLGQERPARYDLIFNDELHQVRGRESMLAVLRGLHGALRPGGALVFFFADQAKPADGVNQCAWDWERTPRARLAWEVRRPELEVSASVVAERPAPDLIALHHVYLVREQGVARVEAATLTRSYAWEWEAILPVLREAGFGRVESDTFPSVHGHRFAMNLAFRE